MSDYVLVDATGLPDDDLWLSPAERRELEGLLFSRRRADWRLGRYAAKSAIGAVTGLQPSAIAVRRAPDGAPEAWKGGTPLALQLSLSHRAGRAVALVAPGATAVGCDLERVEARPDGFAGDWYTRRERAALAAADPALHDRLETVVWSAKESALKALRVGLRRDTRAVEVEAGAAPEPAGWAPLRIADLEGGPPLGGWWRRVGADLILTVAGWDLALPPRRIALGRVGQELPDRAEPEPRIALEGGR